LLQRLTNLLHGQWTLHQWTLIFSLLSFLILSFGFFLLTSLNHLRGLVGLHFDKHLYGFLNKLGAADVDTVWHQSCVLKADPL
jgi:hypothetical protein